MPPVSIFFSHSLLSFSPFSISCVYTSLCYASVCYFHLSSVVLPVGIHFFIAFSLFLSPLCRMCVCACEGFEGEGEGAGLVWAGEELLKKWTNVTIVCSFDYIYLSLYKFTCKLCFNVNENSFDVHTDN